MPRKRTNKGVLCHETKVGKPSKNAGRSFFISPAADRDVEHGPGGDIHSTLRQRAEAELESLPKEVASVIRNTVENTRTEFYSKPDNLHKQILQKLLGRRNAKKRMKGTLGSNRPGKP